MFCNTPFFSQGFYHFLRLRRFYSKFSFPSALRLKRNSLIIMLAYFFRFLQLYFLSCPRFLSCCISGNFNFTKEVHGFMYCTLQNEEETECQFPSCRATLRRAGKVIGTQNCDVFHKISRKSVAFGSGLTADRKRQLYHNLSAILD